MSKEQIQEIAEPLLNFLEKTPDSFLYEQINRPVPETDDEYVSMWTAYIHFIFEKIKFKAGILNNLTYERVSKNMPEVEHYIFDRVRSMLEENIDQKMAAISFQPRLERYLEEFAEHERDNIRKLLIYLIGDLDKSSYREKITSIAEAVDIDMKWVLSLDDDHPLIKEGILEFSGLSIDESEPLQEKEVKVEFVAKKIFLGSKLSDTELYQMKNSPLIELFDLADEEFIEQLMTGRDHHESGDFDGGFDFEDEGEDYDVEDMIASLESDRIEVLEKQFNLEETRDDDEDISRIEEYKKEEETQESEIQTYSSDLEYLQQEFSWLKARAELVEKRHDTFVIDRNGEEKKIKELEQTTGRLKNICELRLKKSIQSGFTPRLAALQKKFRFSDFEINTIKAIITNKLFPTNQGFGTSGKSVGEVLMLLVDDMIDRVRALKYFRKKSKLVKSNIIQLEKSSLGQNLFNCSIEMDTRMSEYLRGENFDISDYVDGGYLYRSEIPLEHVIMDKDAKDEFLLKIMHYPKLVETNKRLNIPSSYEYGNAQVNLFVGPSGTGKTMMANAVSNDLHKKILVFNLNNYSNINYFNEPDKNLFSLLFREARMNDAILFFDEAENLLENRMNDLLLELENHQGIVIFATNASFVIDKALKRRINHVLHFKEPGPILRKKIWEVHLPENIQIADDIDLEKLAMRYEINGGLIKNAVFSSITHAVAEIADKGSDAEVVLKMKHLENGADEQLRNKLFMSRLEKQITPAKSFQDIVLPQKTLKELNKIAAFDKSRKVLVGEWGFSDVFKNMTGRAVLFHGPPGTGKTMSAEALAYETGKHLKFVNYSQVLSKWVGETEKALEALMDEVMETDSILLFDEADGLFASRTNVSSVNDRYANMITNVLLSLTENFNSIAVLTTNYIDNIDPAFYRRMELIEFEMPDKELRFRLWEKLLPEKMPLADDVNLNMLAKKFEFSGGDIKNAIIDAASSRAVILDGPRTVSMDDFLEACEKIKSQKSNGQDKIGFGH